MQAENIHLKVINNRKETLLHLAAKRNLLTVLRTILHKNIINVNAQDKDGNTALHLAIRYDSKKVISFLITIPNIDFNARNNNKETVAYLAAKKGYVNVIEASLW